MSIPTKSLNDIIKRTLAHFRTSFPGLPLGVKRFLGRSARAIGLNIWGLQKSIEDVDKDIVPQAGSSDDALTEWASILALPDGAGGLGRLVQSTATGGASTLSGVLGTIYPDAATATSEDGVTQIKLSGSVTIPGAGTGFGTIAGVFVAITKGTAGNLAAGTVCTWQSPPAGADPTFTLSSGLSGGVDVESNAAVFSRIVQRLQTPPKGGKEEDYRIWAQAGGAHDVWVYPRRSGTGTVDVVIGAAGNGQGRTPSEEVQDTVEDSIGTKRPAEFDGVTVFTAYAPNGRGHYARIKVIPSKTKYNFDWNDSGLTLTVSAYTPGAPATLQMSALPATLSAAITAAKNAGTAQTTGPRLQVISTYAAPIGSVVNPPIRCVDYTGTTVTLQNDLTGWQTPTAGDKIFAYGPIVPAIASAVQSFVDSIGPSRVGGYGDALTPWEDIFDISSLIGIAKNAVDTDGTKFISEVPTGGATIDAATSDVRGTDNSLNGPELLYLSGIAITQS